MNKIGAIKLVRECVSRVTAQTMGLREAKDLVEALTPLLQEESKPTLSILLQAEISVAETDIRAINVEMGRFELDSYILNRMASKIAYRKKILSCIELLEAPEV